MAKDIKPKGSLPHGWVVRTSTKYPDLIYYFNALTNDSTWECPSLDPPRKKSKNFGYSFLSDESNKQNINFSNDFFHSSSEGLDNTCTDRTFCTTLNNYSENRSDFIDNHKLKSSKSLTCSVNSVPITSTPTLEKMNYNRTNSDLDEGEDVDMLDVSQDLQLIEDLPTNASYYIIIDTNVFIHNLKQIGVIKDHDMENCGPPHIFIPWVVIQELDGLKRDSKLKFAALDGVKYINKLIKSKDPQFHGQSPKEVKDWSQEYSRCNDDRILECCMSLADKMPPDKVILLTNDINLANKSLICDISAYDVKSFCRKFNISFVPKKVFSSTNKVSTQFNESVQSVAEKVVSSPKRLLFSPEKKSILSVTQNLTAAANRIKNPTSHQAVTVQHSFQPVVTKDNCEPRADEIKISCIMRKARLSLRKVLSIYLPTELDDAIGFVWRDSKNDLCKLSDQLYLFYKYWDSVFSQHFTEQTVCNLKYLETKFNSSGGFSFINDECITILAIIEDFFSTVKKRKPDMVVPVETIRNNRSISMQLLLGVKMNAIGNNNFMVSCSDPVLQVFEYNWIIMNHLCGVVMDFYGVEHDFVYDKPSVIPSKAEFDRLMCSLYPCVKQLKKTMVKAVETDEKGTPPGLKFHKKFHCMLKNLVPFLQIDVQPLDTTQFNAKDLEDFFKKPENQERISIGYKQLEQFYSKLKEALSLMISSKKAMI